jgi:hypothetical protein
MTVSAQGYEYWKGRISDNNEIERLEQQSKADENAKWRINQMLQSDAERLGPGHRLAQDVKHTQEISHG